MSLVYYYFGDTVYITSAQKRTVRTNSV